MNPLNLKTISLLVLSIYFVCTTFSFAQDKQKDTFWKQYKNVTDVGFSIKSFDKIRTQLDSLGTASLLVIYKGNILFSYGDNTRKFMIHSIRKSMMNALIGIEIQKGSIDLNQSLQQLNIDDLGILTDEEKQATVKDLLSARSGVYHASAYATRDMIKNLPPRGSYKVGKHWYYNNWDFNALLTIYEQKSRKKFFEAFKNEIADPIGMEDFDMEDGHYRFERDKSIHPAYLFKMSARDMARFGLLYLSKGKWKKNQIIPSKWIERSTQPVSTNLVNFDSRDAYGLLWWVSKINDRKVYYASGSGGHSIMVLPEDDLVFVHRVNTYERFSVSDEKINDLALQILKAKDNPETKISSPKLINYNPSKTVFYNIFSGPMDQYIGTYKHQILGEMIIQKSNLGYVLLNNVGTFNLYATSEDTFIIEDIEIPARMVKTSEESKRFLIEPILNTNKTIKEFVLYY